MTATNPFEIDGVTYTHYNISLAINGKYRPDGTLNAMVAATLTPVRFADGEVEECQEQAQTRTVVIGSTATADAGTQQVVGVIQSALQAWINAKGL